MAHTISKQIYDDEKKKYVECEVLILDEEEDLPPTDRREIILSCSETETEYNEAGEIGASNINDNYPETELIDQYEENDDYKDDKFGEEGKRKYFK